MNILLCGNGGALCQQIIQRFNKERHTTFLLTGVEKQKDESRLNAFQVYPFSYSNENLVRIMRSAAADVLVIQGAQDPLYDWRNAQQQSARFLSDLTSLLEGAKSVGIQRVVFLSALGAQSYQAGETAAFADANEHDLFRLISCAENLVCAYSDMDMHTTVLRLPVVFSGCDASCDPRSVCRRMAEQYLWEHELRYIPGEKHREIFYPDAAEAVWRVVGQTDSRQFLHVSGFPFTERDFFEALSATGIVDENILRVMEEEGSSRPELEEEPEEELELQLKYPAEQAARSLLEELQKYREKEDHRQRKKASFWRAHVLPVLETIGLFCIILFLTWLIRDTWVGESLDLFYIFVLLIGVTWGMAHSLFASLLSGVAMFYLMQERGTPLVVDYSFFVHFLELLVIGVIGGFMRDKYRRKNNDLTDENNFYLGEVNDLTRINDSNVYVRNLLEKRLTGYRNSLARIYEITSQLDFMESRRVLFHAVKVLMQIMDTPHAAVYVTSGDSGYFRLAAASSAQARQMGNSIHYDAGSFLYRSLTAREIYQNHSMEEGKPTFAGAVYRSDAPKVIVMVWMNDIMQVNLHNSNMLAILCRLLESSVHRAVMYEESIYRDSYIDGTRIMKESAFCQVRETFEEGRLQGVLQYVLLKVETGANDRGRAARLVRDTDVLGEMNGELYVLLSGSGREEAQYVIDRFAANGMRLEEIDQHINVSQ